MDNRPSIQFDARVTQIVPAADGVMELSCVVGQPIDPLPGQFVHLQVPQAGDMLLRRPISVNTYDPDTRLLRLIIQVKGEGTWRITSLTQGQTLSFTGPFGKAFTPPKGARRMAVVGGGVGVAPMLFAMRRYPDIQWRAFFGYRTKSLIYQEDLLREAASDGLHIATDDGSAGVLGLVTDLLTGQLDQGYAPDEIWACGPAPMARALQAALEPYPVNCMISLEERMGCGIGACLGCVCRIKISGGWAYRRVCSDGPVFKLSEVVFE